MSVQGLMFNAVAQEDPSEIIRIYVGCAMENMKNDKPKNMRRPVTAPSDNPRRKTARERMLELKSSGQQKEDARAKMKKENYKKALLSQVFKKWADDSETVSNDKKKSEEVHQSVSFDAGDVCAVDELGTNEDAGDKLKTRRKVWRSNMFNPKTTMGSEDNGNSKEVCGMEVASDADDEYSVDELSARPQDDFDGHTSKELFGSSTDSADAD